MPKLHEEPLHRLHITVSERDHLWLKEKFGTEGQISEQFRLIIKRLRGESVKSPEAKFRELLEGLTL